MTLPAPTNDEVIGFVFPVYGWGIPNVVEESVRRYKASFEGAYLYAVMTCGDDMGYTDRVLEKALGRKLDAARRSAERSLQRRKKPSSSSLNA